MTPGQDARYARHQLIGWWRQERLAAARVLVAGAGAVGNEVLHLLALLGVGHIVIVDRDEVERSNLSRTVLFREADIGRNKAEAAAEHLRGLNPLIEIVPIARDLEFDIGLGVYRAMDVVVGCLDSINARLALNRACLQVGTPWINAGIEDTLAQVSLFARSSSCFECAMTPLMWERRNERFSCAGLLVADIQTAAPTTVLAASLAAGFVASEVVYMLHEMGDHKEGLRFGEQLTVHSRPYVLSVNLQPRSPYCTAHEGIPHVEVLPDLPRTTTFEALLAKLDMESGEVHLGYDLLVASTCVHCGSSVRYMLPVERCGSSATYCDSCDGDSRQPEIISHVDASSEIARCTLTEAGVPDYAILEVGDTGRRRYVQVSGEYTPGSARFAVPGPLE